MRVRTEQLKYFIETVNVGSINRAADALYVSQSTIFEALNKLEEELDVVLLNRTHSGVTVTAEGRLFFDIATNFLEQLEDYKKIVHQIPDIFSARQSLTLFATPEMVDTVVPELIQLISKKHPALRINLQVGDFSEGLKVVHEDKVDFALILIHQNILTLNEVQHLIKEWKLIVNEVAKTKVMITVNRASSLARKKELSIKEIINLPAVIYKADLDPSWHKKAYAEYGDMNIFFVAGNWDTCDWYNSTHKEVYGFTSKASPIKTITNKKISLKEDIVYSAIVVYKENNLLNDFVDTVIRDICIRYISD